MRKIILNTLIEEKFKLIGINASIEPYKLAFLINKHLRMSFTRSTEDVEVVHKEQIIYYLLYKYQDPRSTCKLFFVQNKSKYRDQSSKFVNSLFETQDHFASQYLVSSRKQTDYFVKIVDEFDRFKLRKMILELNDIPQIISAYEIPSGDVKSPENLIFE